MNGKRSLVTGAAGGIGTAVARTLGRRGVTVAAVDVDAAALDESVQKLVAEGLDVHAFLADISDSQAVETLVENVERRLGPLDYLVNAAGVLRLGQAHELTDDDWTATFAANATGSFLVSRTVARRMVVRSSGAIVTVASNVTHNARIGLAAYAASKAAAAMFTKCLGLELARHKIRCNVVAPGTTDTPMARSLWQGEVGLRASVDGVAELYRVGIPLGKIAQPADIANTVAFLLSDQASHITLETLTVDGGATLGV